MILEVSLLIDSKVRQTGLVNVTQFVDSVQNGDSKAKIQITLLSQISFKVLFEFSSSSL